MERVLEEVKEELIRSNIVFNWFNSIHEGWAVIREELDELWDEVKKSKEVYSMNERMRREAIQVAAMAVKFILSFER